MSSLARLASRLVDSIFADDPPIEKVVIQIRVRNEKGELVQRQFAPLTDSLVTIFPGVVSINIEEADLVPGDDPSCLTPSSQR